MEDLSIDKNIACDKMKFISICSMMDMKLEKEKEILVREYNKLQSNIMVFYIRTYST